jgi:hypothetical protein
VALGLASAPAGIRVETPAEGRHRVSVIGLDSAQRAGLGSPGAATAALVVYAGAIGPETPAMAGRHEVDDEGLHFTPLFRFSPGVAYTARARIGSLRLERRFEVEAVSGDPPRVLAVHPSGETLPENTLRLYVSFSQPMAARDSMRHVRLLEADGGEVPLAFVEVEAGLWDPGGTRLTLFFHPGRVKRGVAPGERLGPPLRAGRSYRLRVDGAMADARGVPLSQPFEHSFRAGEADRQSPAAGGLGVDPPASGGDALVLRLPEPLDRAQLLRWVWIEDERGERIAGRAEVTEAETRWVFRPDRPWTPGGYAVLVERALEDRAGNRFDRLFDREAGASLPAAAGALRLPFAVR